MATSDTKEVKKPPAKKSSGPKLPPPKGVTDTNPNAGGGNKGGGKGKTRADKELDKRIEKFLEKYDTRIKTGGFADSVVNTPATEEFVRAALSQGLTFKEIQTILISGALHGANTPGDMSSTNAQSEWYTSPELVDYLTDHPELFGDVLTAAKAFFDAPTNYAEYLAGGGVPGQYQSNLQILQGAIMGLDPGIREAYLSNTEKGRWLAEGNDPAHWYAYQYEKKQKGKAPSGPSYVGGFDVPGAGYDYNNLNQFGMGDVLSHFMQAQQNKALVEQSGAFFDTADLATESEA